MLYRTHSKKIVFYSLPMRAAAFVVQEDEKRCFRSGRTDTTLGRHLFFSPVLPILLPLRKFSVFSLSFSLSSENSAHPVAFIVIEVKPVLSRGKPA
jgi:hypothetical protein